jgi:pimeloyl-ACP methyl ester carboxylesterase
MKSKIFIIHGWAYDTKKWRLFLDLLERSGFEIVLLDVPGLTAPLTEVWNLDSYVAWLHKIVDKEKDRVILLGHSNGGRICLAYTLRYAERVKQLILLDSAGIYHNELPLRIKRLVFRTIAKVGRRLSESERLRSVLYRLAREGDYKQASPLVRKTMRNLIEVDLTPRLSEIRVPTLIIWGAEDRVTPLSDAKVFHRGIRGARLEIIEGARHSPQFTHAEKVVEIILEEVRRKT